jgi:hypothetical protein
MAVKVAINGFGRIGRDVLRKMELAEFDVFLAHNTEDEREVECIGEALRLRGLNPWLDKEQIPPGRWFQDLIQRAIPVVKSAAIFIGPKGIGRWQTLELRSFISQCVERGIPTIPVLLPGATKFPPELLFLQQLNWVRFRKSIDEVEALDDLEWGVTGEHPKRKRRTPNILKASIETPMNALPIRRGRSQRKKTS